MDRIEKQRDIDQWLDTKLGQYGKAEPRAGLEDRVLASLRAERSRIASRHRWWWALGAASATTVTIAVALWVGKNGHERNPATTIGVSTTAQREGAYPLVRPDRPPKTAHRAREIKQHMLATWPTHDLVAKRPPKLEQFPSRRSLSEAESLLVRRLNQETNKDALFEAAETDLSIGSLEIRPLQIPDIEIPESKTD